MKLVVFGVGGYMGHRYMKILTEIGISSVIGVDINPINLKKISDKYPFSKYTKDIDEALSLKPEIVMILANSPAHLEIIERCHSKGFRKFFVEKPLVYSLEQLQRMEGEEFDLSNLFVGHQINFSGIVNELFSFMKKENLIVLQARSWWGKNWCSVNRVIGGDAEEEIPHPLALILSIISLNQEIGNIESSIKLSYIPYVRPDLVKNGKDLGLGFPEKLNDSSIADFSIETDTGIVNAHILTSFNMYEQQRRVELSFVKRGDSGLPQYKACLEFDVDGKDILRIKDAQTDEEILQSEFSGNKLKEQLKAVLKVFAGQGSDSRLISFDRASMLVRLIQESLNP